jgi:hypothetical protein
MMPRREPVPMRHTAKLRLNEDQILQALQLPEGMRVLRFDVTHDPVSIMVIVESPDLPPVPPECESPYAHASFTTSWDEDRQRIEIDEVEYHWPTHEDIWGRPTLSSEERASIDELGNDREPQS